MTKISIKSESELRIGFKLIFLLFLYPLGLYLVLDSTGADYFWSRLEVTLQGGPPEEVAQIKLTAYDMVHLTGRLLCNLVALHLFYIILVNRLDKKNWVLIILATLLIDIGLHIHSGEPARGLSPGILCLYGAILVLVSRTWLTARKHLPWTEAKLLTAIASVFVLQTVFWTLAPFPNLTMIHGLTFVIGCGLGCILPFIVDEKLVATNASAIEVVATKVKKIDGKNRFRWIKVKPTKAFDQQDDLLAKKQVRIGLNGKPFIAYQSILGKVPHDVDSLELEEFTPNTA